MATLFALTRAVSLFSQPARNTGTQRNCCLFAVARDSLDYVYTFTPKETHGAFICCIPAAAVETREKRGHVSDCLHEKKGKVDRQGGQRLLSPGLLLAHTWPISFGYLSFPWSPTNLRSCTPHPSAGVVRRHSITINSQSVEIKRISFVTSVTFF